MSAEELNDNSITTIEDSITTTTTNEDLTSANSSEMSLIEVNASLQALMVNSDAFFLIIMGIIVFLMQVDSFFNNKTTYWIKFSLF